MFGRDEPPPRPVKKQFSTDTYPRKNHLQGGQCKVQDFYSEPPPKRTVPVAALEAARGIETHFLKARKAADFLRDRNGGSQLYTPGKGWGS